MDELFDSIVTGDMYGAFDSDSGTATQAPEVETSIGNESIGGGSETGTVTTITVQQDTAVIDFINYLTPRVDFFIGSLQLAIIVVVLIGVYKLFKIFF